MSNVTPLEKAAAKLATKSKAKPMPTAHAANDEANHLSLAEQFIDIVFEETGEYPVFSLGAFYQFEPDSSEWKSVKMDALAVKIGRQFSGSRLCKKAADYRQVAGLVATISEQEDFFSDAPGGIAAGGKFYRVAPDGQIVSSPLAAKHRQRMSVLSEPDFEADSPQLNQLLDNALGVTEAGLEQRELLQMAMGAALTCTLWRYRTVLMLYGASSTGKSTLLEVLKRFFPSDRVGATNPANWNNEYHAAALAGRSLNLVGELDANTPIQGGIFKSVTGGDDIEARHPTHRPFSFVCTAGHIFNCNRMPPTRDKSDAFFRRWRIVEFSNSVAVGREIIGLADRIFNQEQASVLAWLINGAVALAKRGSLPETENHRRLIQYWRSANNSALQFILDPDYLELKQPDNPLSAKDVFSVYRKWANEVGVKALGRTAFYEAIGDGGGRVGVAIDEDRDGVKIIYGIGFKAQSQSVLNHE